MKLYLAATYSNGMGNHDQQFRRLSPNAKAAMNYCQYYLESYHYLGQQSKIDSIRRDNRVIFLDSGAFSAFTQGVDVDIEAYARFCKDNADIVQYASVLDAIGDEIGTWQNQHKLEQLGVNVLPCYHYGEPIEVLRYYRDNYEYMTIGGMVPISTPQLFLWLDRVWEELIDGNGEPVIKVHGFGLTSPALMEKYPWYSVDSSSWLQIASFGAVFVPGYGMVHLSAKAPSRKIHGQHFENYSKPVQEKLHENFYYYGFTQKDLADKYMERRAYNALQYTLLAEQITANKEPYKTTQATLL